MKKQFKGIKWLNNNPYFLFFDLNDRKIEKIEAKGVFDIRITEEKKCNGYYDLIKKNYVQCENFFNNKSEGIKQCDICKKNQNFSLVYHVLENLVRLKQKKQ